MGPAQGRETSAQTRLKGSGWFAIWPPGAGVSRSAMQPVAGCRGRSCHVDFSMRRFRDRRYARAVTHMPDTTSAMLNSSLVASPVGRLQSLTTHFQVVNKSLTRKIRHTPRRFSRSARNKKISVRFRFAAKIAPSRKRTSCLGSRMTLETRFASLRR